MNRIFICVGIFTMACLAPALFLCIFMTYAYPNLPNKYDDYERENCLVVSYNAPDGGCVAGCWNAPLNVVILSSNWTTQGTKRFGMEWKTADEYFDWRAGYGIGQQYPCYKREGTTGGVVMERPTVSDVWWNATVVAIGCFMGACLLGDFLLLAGVLMAASSSMQQQYEPI